MGLWNDPNRDLAMGDLNFGSFAPEEVWAGEAPIHTSSAPVKNGIALKKWQVVAMDVNGNLVPWNPTGTGEVGIVYASDTLTFAGNPANAATVNIMGSIYTFKTVPTGPADVQIGTGATDTAANLAAAINANAQEIGATAAVAGNVITLTALNAGTAANAGTLVSSSTAAVAGAATFGASTAGTQAIAAVPESHPVGFMCQPADATGGTINAPYYDMGAPNYDLLIWPVGMTLAKAQQAFARTGIKPNKLDNLVLNPLY